MKIDIQQLIPTHLHQPSQIASKARLLVFIMLAVWFLSLTILILYFTLISTPLVNIIVVTALALMITILWGYFKISGNLVITSHIFLFLSLIDINFSIITSGGINSLDLIWMLVVPCGGFLLLNNRVGLFWGVVCSCNTLVYVIIAYHYPKLLPIPKPDPINNLFTVLMGIIVIISTIYYYVKQNKAYSLAITQKNKQLLQVQEEISYQNEEIKAQRDFIMQKNEALEKRDRQISSSIKAAKVIQTAILPSEQKMQQMLKDYFLIYRPKDVVSGDFYWLNEINGVIFLATVDCTGHGVPGAFMSMIGNTLLDRIIRLKKITDPSKVLQQLHQEVYQTLHQTETQNNYGMDMSLLAFTRDKSHCNIQFCGAKSSLYYYNPQNQQMGVIKGDRKSIGGYQPESVYFQTQDMTLPIGGLIFLSSDGIVDQNNVKRKRFGTKRMKESLLASIDLPMAQQKNNLENTIDAYMQDTTQRDDMLMIGMKL
ncbi:MAG TPA: hypothetical protein DCS93_22415 [Microscillaceae bacterium]|nr:hypothetical protein [Microscillaceae bacterium]